MLPLRTKKYPNRNINRQCVSRKTSLTSTLCPADHYNSCVPVKSTTRRRNANWVCLSERTATHQMLKFLERIAARTIPFAEARHLTIRAHPRLLSYVVKRFNKQCIPFPVPCCCVKQTAQRFISASVLRQSARCKIASAVCDATCAETDQ